VRSCKLYTVNEFLISGHANLYTHVKLYVQKVNRSNAYKYNIVWAVNDYALVYK